MTRSYETVVIYDGALSDDEVRKETKSLEGLISESSEVKKVDEWGRRNLAYPIKKRNSGYYVLYLFDGESDMPAKIDRRLKLDEKVLRYLTVVADPKAAANAAARAAQRSEAEGEGGAAAGTPADAPARAGEPKAEKATADEPKAEVEAEVEAEAKAEEPAVEAGAGEAAEESDAGEEKKDEE